MSEEIVSKKGERYTEQELMTRLKFIIGLCLAGTLIGIVFVVLYSIIFVTQPLNAISPIDSKFFELIIPVATFLCGTLSGIMLAGTGREATLAGMAQQNGLRPGPSLPPLPSAGPSAPSLPPLPSSPIIRPPVQNPAPMTGVQMGSKMPPPPPNLPPLPPVPPS